MKSLQKRTKSANKMEFGTHVSNSAADKAAERRDYWKTVKTATADEIKKFDKRDGLMRALGIPATTNHKGFVKRYGKDRAYFAWKAFKEVNPSFGGAINQDKNYRALEELDDILRDTKKDLDGVKEAIKTRRVTWYTYDLGSGAVVDADETPLYSPDFFQSSGDFSWCREVHFLNTIDDFSDEARIRDLFLVTPEEREQEMARRDLQSAVESIELLAKDGPQYLNKDKTFKFRGATICFQKTGYRFYTGDYELPVYEGEEKEFLNSTWADLRRSDEAYLVVKYYKTKSKKPEILYAGTDLAWAVVSRDIAIDKYCEICAESRKKSGEMKKSSSSTSVTAKQSTANLAGAKMSGYAMPYHPKTDLISVFGLKAIQFGNATSTKQGKLTDEQQEYLARLDEFLTVTADILGIMPEDMGQIVRSYAWAARGKKGAKAHYEPRGHLDNIVNASRKSGYQGSHAHEFGHGIDYFMGWCYARQDKVSVTELASRSEVELPEACRKLVDYLNDKSTKYSKDSVNADKAKASVYYSEPTEKFARAYATFFGDELKDRGISAPFVVKESGEYVQPKGKEREDLNRLFREAIDEMIQLGHIRSAEEIVEDVAVAAAIKEEPSEMPKYRESNSGQLCFF